MRIILALLAFAAFTACGKKSGAPSSPASVAATDLDEASPLDKPYRLKNGEALDVDRLFHVLPSWLEPTYETASYDAALGATVVTGLRFGDAETKGFSAERAEFYGVAVEKIEAIVAVKEARPDAPLELVADKVRLFDIERISAEPGALVIGAVEIDRLRVRRSGLKSPASSGLARFFNAFDVAGVYVKDLKSTSGDEGAAEFAAPDLRLIGLGGGDLKALLAKNLDYRVRTPESLSRATDGLGPGADILLAPLANLAAPADQRMKVARLEWRDISFSGLMEYGLKGERPPTTARDLIDLGTARFLDAETFIGERRLSIVPETAFSAMEFTWLAPSKLRAVTRGGLYDFTAYVPQTEKEAIAVLKSRGLDRVKGDSDLAYDWNADRGDAVFSTGFDTAGLADFDLDVALTGLELKKIEDARAAGAPRPAFDLARLRSFSMIIADEQLLDAFYALSALESGQSEQQVRAAAPTFLRLTKIELGRDNPRVAGYVDALADFLEDGGTLEIRAEPESPVPLPAMQTAMRAGPDAFAEAINLTVERRP